MAFVSDLRGQLQVANGESPGNRYNIQLINALVMYVGTSAIQYLRTKGLTPTMSAIGKTIFLTQPSLQSRVLETVQKKIRLA